jgi:hypothetical protein
LEWWSISNFHWWWDFLWKRRARLTGYSSWLHLKSFSVYTQLRGAQCVWGVQVA